MALILSPSSRQRVLISALALSLCGLSACNTPAETGMVSRDPAAGSFSRGISLYAMGSFFDGQIEAEATVARGLTGAVAEEMSKRKKKVALDYRLTNRALGVNLPSVDQGANNGGIGALGGKTPPVTLLITFHNTGANTITFEIRDVVSKLGNFVPQPESLKLEPGQTAGLEPMISRLGVITKNIPLTLVLRQGDRKETQIINLNPVSQE